MKMLRGKRIISIFMIAIMIVSAVYSPILAERVEASNGNPYSPSYTDDEGVYHPGNCTYTAWEETYKNLGIKLPAWRNAGTWCASAKASGYTVIDYYNGAIPPENCVIEWNGHVGWCVSADSNGVTIKEGNIIYQGTWQKEWQQYWSWTDLAYYRGNPKGFIVFNQNPIGTPSVQKSQFWYDIKDTIHVAVNAANATNYYVAVFKDDQKVYEGHCPNGDLKFAANTYGQGSYGIYFSCYNSKYSKDSEWVNFNVVGPASYTDVSSSKANYAIDENVTIKVSTVCAKGQVIGIDRKKADGSWERVVTQDVPSEYTFKASSLGKGTYSAYFSVYNGSGAVDTTRVNFTIEIDNAQGTVCQHKWNDGNITTQSTCTTTGVKTYACQSCGEKKTETIAKKAHTEVVVPGKAASLTATGLTDGKKCSECGTVIVAQQTIPKLPASSVTPTPDPTPTPEKATIGKVKLSIASYVYNGKVKSPKVIVRDSNGNILKKNVEYTVTTPKGRKTIGKYTYTVKFKGDFAGSKAKKLTLTIKPKAPTITAPRAAKKAVTVKWKKGTKAQVTGYQVMIATNKKFTKNAKTVNIKGYKATSKKVSKLKAKAKYFVRVRTYKTVKGVKIYSNWSKVKTCRTK